MRVLIESRLRMAEEHLQNVQARKPTEEELFADFVQTTDIERVFEGESGLHDFSSVESLMVHADDVAAFVDGQYAGHAFELIAAQDDVRGLTELLRLIDTDVDAAIIFLDRELDGVRQVRASMEDTGADLVLTFPEAQRAKAKQRFRASFEEEIQFLGMMRRWLGEEQQLRASTY